VHEATAIGFAKRISPRSLPVAVFEAQEHGERPFEFAVEMDLVAAEPLQLIGVERLTERPKNLIATRVRAKAGFARLRRKPDRPAVDPDETTLS
jgi:hypothetical protein